MRLVRNVLGWLEIIGGGLILGFASLVFVSGIVTGHHDPRHGGAYLILSGVIGAVVGIGLLAAGLVLRRPERAAWLAQAFPVAIVGWILWDMLRH